MSITDILYTTNIRTRIALTIPVTAVIATFLIGLWSYLETRKSVYNHTYEAISIVLEDTVNADIVYRSRLLKKSHMDSVDFFVKEYQREALTSIRQKSEKRSGFFIIYDYAGNLLLGGESAENDVLLQKLKEKIGNNGARDGQIYRGHLTEEGTHHLFAATAYPSWRWKIYYVISDFETHGQIGKIFQRSLIIISAIMVVVVFLILQLLKKFIFNRISLLKAAARDISHNELVGPIDIQSKDDFGDLARSMEKMAAELLRHERRQRDLLSKSDELNTRLTKANRELSLLQDDLDEQVKERTITLERIHAELHGNLKEMEGELEKVKEKNNRLVKKLSELTLKQSDMVNHHSEVLKKLKTRHDINIQARKEFEQQ